MSSCMPLLALLALGFTPLPPADHARQARADLAGMQGSWVLDHALVRGEREAVGQECVWTIKGDCLTTTLDGKPGSTSHIRLDASSSLRSIDLRHGADAEVARGRYSVQGDTLTVSMGERRPRDLTGAGPCNGVWVFKRKRP